MSSSLSRFLMSLVRSRRMLCQLQRRLHCQRHSQHLQVPKLPKLLNLRKCHTLKCFGRCRLTSHQRQKNWRTLARRRSVIRCLQPLATALQLYLTSISLRKVLQTLSTQETVLVLKRGSGGISSIKNVRRTLAITCRKR